MRRRRNDAEGTAGWSCVFLVEVSMRLAPARLRRSVVLAAVVATASAAAGLAGPGAAVAAQRTVSTSSWSPSPTPTVTPTPGVIVSPSHVAVPEGGSAVIHVRLSGRPSYGWVTVDSEPLSGDSDLRIGPRLLFPADTWSTWQTLLVFAEEDADSTNGTATFLSKISQLPGTGTAVWSATELDNDGPTPSPAPSPAPS
ncbi:hypothetical protein [Microbispora amethystogenes]|nr:hypothetical protein [Microbispora amethystogenes]